MLRPVTLLKETLAQVLSCELCEISKNTFFKEHLRATASVTFPFSSVSFYTVYMSLSLKDD